jgi:hypothetical protein
MDSHYVRSKVFLFLSFQSRPENPKIIENCTNITTSFCDLTDVWKETPETYIPMLEAFSGNTTLVRCLNSILSTNSELISVSQPQEDHLYLLCHEIGSSAKLS